MNTVKFEDLKEGGNYIVASPILEDGPKLMKSGKVMPGLKLGNSELEMNFEYERFQWIKLIKIEDPFFIIKSRHSREFITLRPEWTYYEPSEEFIKALKPTCSDEYD